MERTEILERVWAAKEEKRRRGELAQSKIVLPWGVDYDAGRGFSYKPEAERVRGAFRDFLAGNQSYVQLARLVGVTPRGMHLIMRNPIWMGWRVIDKKRDMSAAGRYAAVNGRQADRRKIARAPEDVIRIKVISEPLISEAEFQAVQRMMDLKEAKHWRTRPHIVHRFTYNGFLTCSACGEVVHTAVARRDYYACKGRRTAHLCSTKYMAREKLETMLDALFADQLTDRQFIERCVEELEGRERQSNSVARIQRLNAQMSDLRERRTRLIDAFLEGMINRGERDVRLAAIDGDMQTAQHVLMCTAATQLVDIKSMLEAFAPLVEWEYWTRDQKRSVLATLTPDIRVADYQVATLGLNPAIFSNENTRTDTGSSPLPA